MRARLTEDVLGPFVELAALPKLVRMRQEQVLHDPFPRSAYPEEQHAGPLLTRDHWSPRPDRRRVQYSSRSSRLCLASFLGAIACGPAWAGAQVPDDRKRIIRLATNHQRPYRLRQRREGAGLTEEPGAPRRR